MEPTTIIDLPIPLLEGGYSQPSGTASDPVVRDSGAATPNINVDRAFPVAIVAVDTLSTSLNTETKRIMGEYTFDQLGAIKISSTVHPLANIAISPDGLVATDANGNTTVAIDGATGSATFMGSIEAASVITGAVDVGNNSIIIDGANERIIMNDGSNNRLLIGST